MDWKHLAQRQDGAVGRSQLCLAGYSVNRIEVLLRNGNLAPSEWPATYVAAGSPPTFNRALWLAVLGSSGTLSHLSAAYWWGIEIPSDGDIHVIAPQRRRREAPAGVRIHRLHVEQRALTHRLRMPITTRAETVLDCAGLLPLSESSTLLDRALQQRWLVVRDIENRLRDQPGRRGNTQLRRLLKASQPGARSESERLMLHMLRKARVNGWRCNHLVVVAGHRYYCDVAFPERKLAIEIDGWAYHSDVARFRQDRARQNALIAAGWTVLRFTWWDLVERPDEVMQQIAGLL